MTMIRRATSSIAGGGASAGFTSDGIFKINIPDGPWLGTGAIQIGDDLEVATNAIFRIQHTITGLDSAVAGINAGMHNIVYGTSTTAFDGVLNGVDFNAATPRSQTANWTGPAGLNSAWIAAVWEANADCAAMNAIVADLWVYYQADGPAGKEVDTAVWFRAVQDTLIQQDRVNNLYGMYIPAIVKGATNNIGIYVGATSTATGRNMSIWSAGDVEIDAKLYIGDTSNANMTLGLTINQLSADDQIFCLRSTDITTGLTSVTGGAATSTNDFMVIQKLSDTLGGVWLKTFAESAFSIGMYFNSWSGAPDTTNATTSLGSINFFVGQHNGSNADADMAADSNAVVMGEIDSNGVAQARLILKADDGQLFLDNNTLGTFDNEDDILLIRAMQVAGARSGIVETVFDQNPFYNYEYLKSIGLAGPKNPDDGHFLIPVQDTLSAMQGAMFQLFQDVVDIARVLPEDLKAQLNSRNRQHLALIGA